MHNYDYMYSYSCVFLLFTHLTLAAWRWPLHIAETCSCCHNTHNNSCILSVGFTSIIIQQAQLKCHVLFLNNAIFAQASLFSCHTHLGAGTHPPHTCMYVCMYIGFKTSFYVVRHLDSTASYLPTGLHLGFFVHGLPYVFHPVFLRSSSRSGENVVLTLFKPLGSSPWDYGSYQKHKFKHCKFLSY